MKTISLKRVVLDRDLQGLMIRPTPHVEITISGSKPDDMGSATYMLREEDVDMLVAWLQGEGASVWVMGTLSMADIVP